jgi:3',5'-cyclic AMP phosphodiesterase CpdA
MSETTIIHLTDLHIEAETGEPFFFAADTTMQTLRQTLDYLRERGLVPGHPVVITGDLVMHNERASYARLRPLVEELRGQGGTVLLGLGNHDERAAFRAVMLGDETTDPAQPYYYAEWFGGLRVIVLDSSTPGSHTGAIGPEQLAWLRAELATPAPEGTLLAVHHPPTMLPEPSLHYLSNSDQLREVLAGTDVCAILSGHTHSTIITTVAGIPCVAVPGTAFIAEQREDGHHLLRWAGVTVVTVRDGVVEIKPLALPGSQETVRMLSHEQMQAAVAAHA